MKKGATFTAKRPQPGEPRTQKNHGWQNRDRLALAPELLADLLLRDGSVADCALLFHPTASGDGIWVAYVVPDGPFDPRTFTNRLRDQLPAEQLPDAWVPLLAIPRASDGTVDSTALEALEILDDTTLRDWEQQLLERPEIENAAVDWVQEPLPPAPRFHLADLIPGHLPPRRETADPQAAAPKPDAVHRSVQTSSSGPEPTPLAIVDGGELNLEGQPSNLPGLLRRAAERAPDKGILYLDSDGEEHFQPYPELHRDAEALLAGLRQLGLRAGDKVLFQLEQRRDLVPALWACLLGGFVPLPAGVADTSDPASSAVARLLNAWRLLDGPLVLADHERGEGLERLAGQLQLESFRLADIEVLRKRGEKHASAEPPRHEAEPDDLAILLMTSGSTGKPKLVTHTHRSLLSREVAAVDAVGWRSDDISLNWLSLDHVASLADFHFRDVFLGCQQIQAPTATVLENPLRWLDWIDRYRVSITWAPSFAYGLLAESLARVQDRSWDLSCLRCALNGGEAIVARTARACLRALEPHGLPADAIQPVWGMAETASGATYSHLLLDNTHDDDPFVEVGGPVAGISLRIVDESLRVLPEGAVGQLQVKGPIVTPGYYRRPELNREVFTHDGWFRTGDLAVLRNGRLTLTGRESDVVIVHGLNYYSHEIESVVEEVTGVQPSFTAACGVREPGDETDHLAIFFHTPVRDPGALRLVIEEIRERVLRQTGLHPSHVVPVPRSSVPKTAIGKIQRSVLKRLFESGELDDPRRRAELLTGGANTVPGWFFERVWRPRAISFPGTRPTARCLLVLVDRDGLGDTLLAALAGLGVSTVRVEPGPAFEPTDDGFRVPPGDPEAFRRLLQEAEAVGGPVDGFVDLWSYGAEPGDEPRPDDFIARLRALGTGSDETVPRNLWLVSSRSQSTDPDDPSCPRRSLWPVLTQAAGRDLPGLRCRHLDLPPVLRGQGSLEQPTAHLLAELCTHDGESEIAWRGDRRLVPGLRPWDFPAARHRPLPFCQGGVYLLTGGLGGIGTALARHLLERYRARLLLIGRAPLDTTRRDRLRELEALGGEVIYRAADVTDAETFLPAVREALATWDRPLDGVLHLAGSFHQASLLEETPSGLTAALAPKLAGSQTLERLIRGTEAFFIGFSSVSSHFGGATIGAYSAANRGLETFCRELRRHHAGDVYCLAWSLWDEIGMSRGNPQVDLLRTRGYEPLSARQGIDSLLAALASGSPELLIGLDPGNRLIARQAATEPRPLRRPRAYVAAVSGEPTADLPCTTRDLLGRDFEHELRPVADLPQTPNGAIDRQGLADLDREAHDSGPQRPASELERQLAALFRDALGTDRIDLGDNFFQLGGHSILATQMLSRLRQTLGVSISTVQFLAGPTVAQLAEEIEALHRSDTVPGTTSETVPDMVPGTAQQLLIVPRPELRFEPFPLTEIQQAYWIGESADLELGDVAMHLYQEIEGEHLDPRRLETAWGRLVERHDMLRVIILADGRGQVLDKVPSWRLRVVDLRQHAAPAVTAALDATRREMSHQRFALDRWPGFEIRVSLLPGGHTRVHFSTSLVHLDGGSFYLLMSEWGELYHDLEAPLPSLDITYADYARAVLDSHDTDDYRTSAGYWQERLAQLPPAPALPLVRGLATIEDHRFVNRRREIPEAVWKPVQRLAHKKGLSRSAVLLTAYATVLDTWSQGAGLSLNVTLFRRPPLHPQINDIVGDFTSTVLVAVQPDPEDHFESLARRVQKRLWSDLEHRQVSGVTVLRELARLHNEHSSALMPYVFTSALDLEMRGATSPGSALRRLGENVFHISQTPQVVLDFLTYEENDDLVLIWDAVEEAFPAGLLDDMLTALTQLLTELAFEDQWTQKPHLVPESQLAQRRALNHTKVPREPALLHTLFHARAAECPEHPAVIAADRTLTYGELDHRARRVAAWLRHRGARPNTLVAVVIDKGWQQVVGVLGALGSGAAYLPIDPEQPRDRRFFLLANGEVDLVLTTARLDSGLEWPEGPARLAVDGEIPELPDALAAPAEPSPEDLAYVIFTSGSTGVPKGVMIDHRGAVNTLVDINRRFGIGPHDRVLALSALNFDLSVYDIFGLLAAGGTVVMPEASATRDPRKWLRDLRRHRVTVWNSVPALMEMVVELAASRKEDLGPDLRRVMLSGDWIPVTLPDHIRSLAPNAEVVSLGGATEASIWSILYPIDRVDPAWTSIPYGRPMENQRFEVLDRALRPRPVWVPGDLYIGGIGLALGYWRDEAKTAASFIVHPTTGERLYRTGDLGRTLPDGCIEFLGRSDNQVKIHGHRIELGEIEAVLATHQAVAAAVVLAVGEKQQDRHLVAWVVPADGATPKADSLRHHLEQKLPHYMVPAIFSELAELPLSATGKVDRKALAQKAPDLAPRPGARGGEPVAPRNTTEEALVELWCELLDLEHLGIHDDLLLLGGDSLKAILAIARLRDQFRVEVPLRALLGGHPTVADLATAIAELRDRGVVPSEGLPHIEAAAADRHCPFPLHAIQEAYWIGRRDAFELGNVAAYFYLEVELPELDLPRLTAAWQRVIERHDMLRAIVLADGQQQILEQIPPYEIAELDLTASSPRDAEAQLAAIRERMSQQVLAADRWPLFELRTTRLPGSGSRMHFGLDLLISDAWSVQILFADLERFYRRPELRPAPLELTYRDYLLAERDLADSELFQRSREYWWQRLDSLPPAPQLPLVKDPSEIEDPVFVRRRATLEPDEWRHLKELASQHGLTPSGLLLTVFAEVLAVWSREPRFVLNVTTFNRLPLHPEVDHIVGDFTSLTLLEVDTLAGGSLVERAGRLQEQLWEDLEHRYISGVRVLRELARRQGRNPGALAPIVFTSLLARHEDTDSSFLPLDGELVFATSQTPQVWLDHQVLELDGGLAFTWDVVEELLPPGLLDDLFTAYVTLLQSLATDEAPWRAERPRLIPATQLAERAAANDTHTELPRQLLHQPLLSRAHEQGEHPAVIAGTRTLSYHQLESESRVVAGWLRHHEARPDSLVAVVMDKGWEQVVAVLGVVRSGAAYLPIAPDLPAARRDFLLRHGGVSLVLTQTCWAAELEWPEGIEVLPVDRQEASGDEQSTDLVDPDLENLAYVIFTSGSTGTPKGVMIDHRGAMNTIADINHRFRVGPRDRTLALSALNFDLSVYDIFGLLAAGGTVVMPEPAALRDPRGWLDLLHRERVTVWNSVPALLEMLVEYLEPRGERLPPCLRLVLLSGDWIPTNLPDRLRALAEAPTSPDTGGLDIVSLGGATEASIWSIVRPIGAVDPAWASIPYGRPLANQRFHVLSPALEPCPAWVPGELYIAGTGLARGYWRDAARTAAQFFDHPQSGERLYRTGDLGRYLPGGEIEFLGREDNQVKIQGHRIELGEIEAVLGEHPAVARAVVVVAGTVRRLFAFFVPAGGPPPDGDELIRLAADRLPSYMVPAVCLPVEPMPLTTNGKVDRKALVALAENAEPGEAVDDVCTAPRSPLETQLVDLWCELLEIDHLGVHDALFDLGGNSLLAIRLLARVQELFTCEVSLRALLEEPTVAGLALLIEAQRSSGEAAVAEALPPLVPRPAERFVPFPLNEVQQAYWLGRMESMELGNVAAHFYFELELETTHPENIQAAWRRLVARHDMLRTVFLPDGEQRVLEQVPHLHLPLLELADKTPAEAEGALLAVRRELSHQVLPTDRWPLFDIRTSHLGGRRYRLHFSFDLLIADAWSARLLFQEFAALYRQPELEMAPLELTFRDYVTATEAMPETAAYRRAEAYWSQRLPQLPAAPRLPLAKDPASLDTPRFVRRSGRLRAELWERLKSRASRLDLTPSGLLLAAYAEVLAKWSAQPRFTLNVTTFNRFPIHPRINDVIGDFTSLTLLAVDAAAAGAGSSFEARARRVQQQLWADLDHRHVSGVQVLRDLARHQGRAPGALMPVVFTSRLFHGAESGDSFLDVTGGEVVYAVSQTPQVWLDKQVDDDGGDLVWTWDAVEELFPAGLLDDMFAAYGQLLETLAEHEESWSREHFELLPESQRALVAAANASAGEAADEAGETTLHELFLRRAQQQPEKPAVITTERQLTYGELESDSALLGAWLQGRGAQRDSLVAVVMDKGWEQVVATLGVVRCGAAYLPIDPEWPTRRRNFLLAQGEVRIVLTQPRLLGDLEWPEGLEIFSVSPQTLAELPAVEPEPRSGPADLAYVIFTSGSTGEPKGVAIEHRGAVNTVLDINRRFAIGPDDRVLALSALTFDLSVWDVFGILAAGGALVLPEPEARRDPSRWAPLLHSHRITVWNSVPALLELLVEHLDNRDEPPLGSLRLALLSGDWLPLDIAPRLHRHAAGAAVISLGGATEASIWSILFPVTEVDPAWPSIPYGKAMANQEFFVLDHQLRQRPVWVPGELYIGGHGLAREYWRDETKTAAAFVEDAESGRRLYHTGDLGRLLPDGNIEFLGRGDAQVKVQGYRIELGEIEAALLRHPEIAAAVVTAPETPKAGGGRGGRRLVAHVVARDTTHDLDPTGLREFLTERLPHYMVPGTFLELEALPLTANGKVDRSRLEARGLELQAPPTDQAGAAPRTPVESSLCSLWRELLAVDRVGIHDSLFDLGGNSLLAIQLSNRIRDSFGVEISLQELFRDPTVAHLAAEIAQTRARHGTATPTALPTLVADLEGRGEPFPLNEVQQAYWVGRMQGIELGNVAAHSYTEVENIDFDLAAFDHALQQMIRRHDALRTIIQPDGRQRILAEVPPYEIAVLDLRGRSADEVERGIAAVRAELSHQVLATDRWPIFEIRATLLDGAPGQPSRTRLHLSFDLLISDAWSSQILFRELAQISADPDLELPALDISFRDYVLAELRLEGTELHIRSRNYWQRRLAEMPPAPELPMVADADLSGTPHFIRRTDRLDTASWERLQELGTEAGLTPSGLLLAAFSEVLAHWSKSPRFTLNLTTFNRLPLHPQVNDLMGDFTSLTLLAADLSGGESFAIHARRIQEQLWADLDHRYVNGVSVMRDMARIQGRPAAALMPIVFTSRLFRDGRFGEVADLRYGEVVYSVSQTPQVWLDHQVVDEEDGLAWTWDVVDELFPPGLIDQLFTAYGTLLRRLAAQPAIWEQPVGPLLTPAAQLEIRAAVNRTAAPLSDELLQTLFTRQVTARERQPAVIDPRRSLTYGELAEAAWRIGRWLRQRGARPGTLVAVVMDKGWEQAAATLGILCSGAAYLPIDPALPASRLAHLLERGQAQLALTQSWLDPAWPADHGIECLAVDTAAFDPELEAAPLEVTQGPDDLAYVIFTSGSTGQPKGVSITHRGAVNTVLDINRRFAVGPEDRVLALSALNFDLSVYDFFGLWAAGGTVVLPPPGSERNPTLWNELLHRHHVSLWNSVPTLLEMLVETDAGTGETGNGSPSHQGLPACLRLVLLSGDWIPLGLPPRIHQRLPEARVISLGGATEASIWSILHPISEIDAEWKSIPYGRPMVNQTFHVLDENLSPRPDWVPGELYIGGVGLARDYWRDGEKTAAAFRTHPVSGERLYRTGDLGRTWPDGTIEFLGREDQQVKVQGYRIELGEIEATLAECPGVASAVVTAPPVISGQGRRLVGYVVLSEPGEHGPEARPGSAETLEPPSTPRFGVITDPLERLQFKLERRGLRSDLGQRTSIDLPGATIDEALLATFARRRSHRRFVGEEISRADFDRWLSCLRQIQPKGLALPKYRYPSGGGLYPVQTYLQLRDGAVQGLAGGLYAYHPKHHQLLFLGAAEIDLDSHGPENRGIVEQAAFSLLLVGKLGAVAPLYPQTARAFCLLEAGYMGQLLMQEAPASGIGLCPLGGQDFAALRPLLGIAASDPLVHCFAGGRLAAAEVSLRQALQEESVPPPRFADGSPADEASVAKTSITGDTSTEGIDWSGRAISDPVARLEFKLAQHGLPAPTALRTVELQAPELDGDLLRSYAERRSCRSYLPDEISLEALGGWLGCLRSVMPDGLPLPKYRYPSGGGLYPVQTYLWVKPGRIRGLRGGTYAYDPVAHRLVLLHPDVEIDRRVHGEVNRPIFDRSAFSLFLIGDLGAVAPLYPGLAEDFCLLEAGYMGQLLMSEGPAHQIGVVPLGGLDFAALRASFELGPEHLLVHLLEGGHIPPGPASLFDTEPQDLSAPPTTALEIPSQTPKQVGARSRHADAAATRPEITGETLKAFLRDRLPSYMVPPTVQILDHLPLTANGKIDRRALPLPEAAATRQVSEPSVAPRSDLEQDLAAMVRGLLGVEQVGIHDNLFELGATSVQIIQLQLEIRQKLGRELAITDLFRHPNVLALAEALAGETVEETVEAGQEQARRRKAAAQKRRRRQRSDKGETS